MPLTDTINLGSLISNTANQYTITAVGLSGGLSGYYFDIPAEDEAAFSSDVTDHFVEQNYAIQDHVAQKPLIVTLHGFAAEVTAFNAGVVPASASVLAPVLGVVSGFSPTLASQTQQLYNQISSVTTQVGNAVTQATSLYNLITNASTTSSKQQAAFNFFYQMWQANVLFTIQSPFVATPFQNMLIINCRALQKDDNGLITDFMVTFKQIRTVSSVTSTPATSGVTT